MLRPGRERIRRLRHAGEKFIEDALMIPDTLPALVAVAKAAEGLPWVLAGSLAVSCYMESRATVVIEILVADEATREAVLSRVGPMPEGYEHRIRTAGELGLVPDTVTAWHGRARRDVVDSLQVFVPLPRDLFVLLLAEPGVIAAPAAMSYACRLHQVHGPFSLGDVAMSEYQQERLGEAAAILISNAAAEIERSARELDALLHDQG